MRANVGSRPNTVKLPAKPSPADIERVEKGHFAPGKSGNPSGRPKGAAALARALMERTGDLATVVEFMVGVAEGTATTPLVDGLGRPVVDQFGEPIEAPPTLKERMEASKWIVDRTIGRAAEVIKLEAADSAGAGVVNVVTLSVDQLKTIRDIGRGQTAAASLVDGSVTGLLPNGDNTED